MNAQLQETKEPLRERKKRRTRRAIIESAWALFERKGFEATTLDEIAEAADIHKQTVLRYFSAKEDIAFAGRVRLFQSFQENLARREGTVLEFWRAYIAQNSEPAGREEATRRWFEFIDSDTRLIAYQLRLNQQYQEVLSRAISLEAGVDPEHDILARSLAALLVAGNSEAARLAARYGDGQSLPRFTVQVVDLAERLSRANPVAVTAMAD